MTTKTQNVFLLLLTATVLTTPLLITQTGFASEEIPQETETKKYKAAFEKLSQKMETKNLSDIPLVGTFVDQRDGKLLVVVDAEGKETKSEYERRVKALINDPTIEIKLYEGYFTRDSCSARDDNCDPLYGGIEVYSPDTSDESSLTIGATNTSEDVGFVMSGHAAGAITTSIKQGGTTDTVGEVITNPSLDNRKSDAAFVELTSTEDNTDQVFESSSSKFTVTGTASPSYQDHVMISGVGYGGISDGYVTGTDLTVYDEKHGTLKEQVAADYISYVGDSGAPVMEYRSDAGDVTLYGIHVGKLCLVEQDPCPQDWTVTVFSEWSNVESELSLDTIP